MEDRDKPGPRRDLILLTGTPLSSNDDVHGYTALLNKVSGESWGTIGEFRSEFVEDYDYFDEPLVWRNHDRMQAALMHNAVTVHQEDVLTELPPLTVTPFEYALSDEHMVIYNKVAREKLLEFEGQDTISFTNSSAAAAAMQQVVIGVELYAKDEEHRVKLRKQITGLEVVDHVLERISGKKIIVFAYYQKSIEVIMQHLAARDLNPVEISGRTSNNQTSIDTFKSDDSCKAIVIQIASGGAGLEFQDDAHHVLFMEFPKVAKDFRQAVARVYRKGQKHPVQVWVATALKTVQVRQLKNVMAKDEEVNRVQVTSRDLRDYLYGE